MKILSGSPIDSIISLIHDANPEQASLISRSNIIISKLTEIEGPKNTQVDIGGVEALGLLGTTDIKYNRVSLPSLFKDIDLTAFSIGIDGEGGTTITLAAIIDVITTRLGIDLTVGTGWDADLANRNITLPAKGNTFTLTFGPPAGGSLRLLPGDITMSFRALGLSIDSALVTENVAGFIDDNNVVGGTHVLANKRWDLMSKQVDFSKWIGRYPTAGGQYKIDYYMYNSANADTVGSHTPYRWYANRGLDEINNMMRSLGLPEFIGGVTPLYYNVTGRPATRDFKVMSSGRGAPLPNAIWIVGSLIDRYLGDSGITPSKYAGAPGIDLPYAVW